MAVWMGMPKSEGSRVSLTFLRTMPVIPSEVRNTSHVMSPLIFHWQRERPYNSVILLGPSNPEECWIYVE